MILQTFMALLSTKLMVLNGVVWTPVQHTIWPEWANAKFGHLEIHERDAVPPFQKSHLRKILIYIILQLDVVSI